jgi:hypothetical protein
MSLETYVGNLFHAEVNITTQRKSDSLGTSCAGQVGRLVVLPNATNVIVETAPRDEVVEKVEGAERYEVFSKSVKLDQDYANIRFTKVVDFEAPKVIGEWQYTDLSDKEEFKWMHEINQRKLKTFANRKRPKPQRDKLSYIYVNGWLSAYRRNNHTDWGVPFNGEPKKYSQEEVVEELKKQIKGKFFFTILNNDTRREFGGKPILEDAKQLFHTLGMEALYESDKYNNRIHEGVTNYLTTIVLKG